MITSQPTAPHRPVRTIAHAAYERITRLPMAAQTGIAVVVGFSGEALCHLFADGFDPSQVPADLGHDWGAIFAGLVPFMPLGASAGVLVAHGVRRYANANAKAARVEATNAAVAAADKRADDLDKENARLREALDEARRRGAQPPLNDSPK
jgi:hypothetical protein